MCMCVCVCVCVCENGGYDGICVCTLIMKYAFNTYIQESAEKFVGCPRYSNEM